MKKRIKILSALCTLVLLSASLLSSCFANAVADTNGTGASSTAPESTVTTAPESTEDTSDGASADPEETTDKNASLTAAPDLTLYDMSGKSVKLSDFFGKPIVLNFWASWCPPCIGEFPEFAEVCREYNGEVVFLFVNCFDGATETMRTVQSFIATNGYGDLPIYLDKTNARQAYGVSAIPFTFFINADGYIASSINSSIPKDRLLTEIATPAK